MIILFMQQSFFSLSFQSIQTLISKTSSSVGQFCLVHLNCALSLKPPVVTMMCVLELTPAAPFGEKTYFLKVTLLPRLVS